MNSKLIWIFLLIIFQAQSVKAEYKLSGFTDKEIYQSWNDAEVYIPTISSIQSIQSIDLSNPPNNIVIFLHGCTGINNNNRKWANFLKKEGYVVILPNDFAINGKPVACDVKKFKSTNKDKKSASTSVRLRSIENIIAILKENDVFTKSNVFLMGHSEGGKIVNRFKGGEVFNAIVSSGHGCKDGRVTSTISDIPFAYIYSKNDPWLERYYSDGSKVNCKNTGNLDYKNRKVFIAEGREHSLVNNDSAVKFVLDFLRANRNKN